MIPFVIAAVKQQQACSGGQKKTEPKHRTEKTETKKFG